MVGEMKKHLFLGVLILILLCFLFAACTPNQSGSDLQVQSLRIHEVSPRIFALDEGIDLSQVWIVAELKNGEEREIPLSDTMIADKDRAKFSTPTGQTTVLIHYGGKIVPFEFSVIKSRQQKKYRVQFESNGGSPVETMETSLIEAFTMSERTGYVFHGWFDNVDCIGDRIKVPYEVTENKIFYAKWVDNRSYKVEFLDRENEVISNLTQIIVHGENVEENRLPAGPIVEGFIFREWLGQMQDITSDVQLRPRYERVELSIVFIERYGYPDSRAIAKPIYYGDRFDFLDPDQIEEFEEKEGYTGNWHILRDDDSLEPIFNKDGDFISTEFEQVKKNLTIVPHYERIMFTVTFKCDEYFVGMNNSWPSITRVVEYGGDLSLTAEGNVDISKPQPMSGHTSSWAIRIDEVWTAIKDSSKWEDIEREWLENPNPQSQIEYLRDGEIVAIITQNGNIIRDIKSDITLEAKYLRNTYTLKFVASGRGGASSSDLQTLYVYNNIKFGSKFSLYHLDMQNDIQYGSLVKKDFVRYNCLEDWNISWHTSASYDQSNKIEFENGQYITIDSSIINPDSSGEKSFYAYDIDLREYTVSFYDWDFATQTSYRVQVTLLNGDRVEQQIVPFGGEAVPPVLKNKLEYGYELLHVSNHWHDAPQDKSYAEPLQVSNIKKDMVFYARYRIVSFSILLRDYYYPYDDNDCDHFNAIPNLPQVTYYQDEFGQTTTSGYLLMESHYTRNYGYLFGDSEIYYGGSTAFESLRFIEQYDNELLNKYNSIDLIQLNADIEYYQGLIARIKAYEQAVLDYTTTPQEQDFYQNNIANYDDYREQLYEKRELLNFYTDYKFRYYEEGDNIPTGYSVGDKVPYTGALEREYNQLRYGKRDSNGEHLNGEHYIDSNGNFIDNGDYQRYIKLFYNTLERPGFVFDGWYTSSSFHIDTRISQYDSNNNLLTNLLVNEHIVLYAKWIDLNKGSDGLMFALRDEYIPGQQEPYHYYEVIDYLTSSQFNEEYSLVSENGIEYYVNENKGIRIEVGRLSHNDFPQEGNLSADVRLPSFHEGLPVKRIAKTLFVTNGSTGKFYVRTIDIAKRIEQIEEDTFSKCTSLELITIDEENVSFMVYYGVLYTIDGATLICYPANNQIVEYYYNESNILVLPSTFIVPSTVQRIATGAFIGCSALRYIAFEDEGDIALTIGEKAFSGLTHLNAVGKLIVEDNYYIADSTIPDRLVAIEALAFEGCFIIAEFNATQQSNLIYVGEKALVDTKWYKDMLKKNADTFYVDGTYANGVIVLGYVVLGIIQDFNQLVGTEIFLDDQVRAVADNAFEGSDNITKVVFGSNHSDIMYIGFRAFYQCTQLNHIEVYKQDPNECYVGEGAFGGVSYFSIFVPNIVGVVDAYKNAPGWEEYAEYIQAI